VIARVSPQYIQTAQVADCGGTPPTAAAATATGAPILLGANAATPFAPAVPCGPDGRPAATAPSTEADTRLAAAQGAAR